MLIEGEKYACEACVRGHRVSTCQHSDRPLTHINKKGRPVSQCPHCRGLRKTRGTHPACECGSKAHGKDDCHSAAEMSESEAISEFGDKQAQACCCSHGMKCTCALKTEPHLDSVPEVDALLEPPARNNSHKQHKYPKAGSEAALTVFANGHHKPVHRNNDSAHHLGIPYKIPIPHSISGNADVARRSADSLPLPRRRESPRADDVRSALSHPYPSKSEHNSPPASSLSIDQLQNLDFASYLPASTDRFYTEEFVPSPFYNLGPESGSAVSTGVASPAAVDWSAVDLALNASNTAAVVLEGNAMPSTEAVTSMQSTSSSEQVSEISDYVSYPSASVQKTHSDQGTYRSPQNDRAISTPNSEDRGINRLSTASFTSTEPGFVPPASLDLDFTLGLNSTTNPPSEVGDSSNTYTGAAPGNLTRSNTGSGLASSAAPSDNSNSDLRRPGFFAPGGAESFEKHGFTVHDAQMLAHPETPTEALNKLALPSSTSSLNPSAEDQEAGKSHIWTEGAHPSETTGCMGSDDDEAGEPSWD